MLIEATIAMVLLGTFAFVTMKGSLDLTAPRKWVMYQTLTDAYLSYEQAYAERISFDIMNGTDVANGPSPWVDTATAAATPVNLGTLPGGIVLTGTITRTRTADPQNIPLSPPATAIELAAAKTANPAEVESWILESHLTYNIGTNTYHKSRTVVRSR